MDRWTAVILAAGKGKRMKSKKPKVLHEICGQPMVAHVSATARAAGVPDIAMVIGNGAGQVRSTLGEGYTYVEQLEQLGTGHALLQALPVLDGSAGRVLVVNGDLPLVRPETLHRLMDAHDQTNAAMTLLTCDVTPSEGLGRIIRDRRGKVKEIREWADATEEERRQSEINVGAYGFDLAWMQSSLPKLRPSKGGEIYLTDLMALAYSEGRPIEALRIADPLEALGVDTRIRLAQAEAAMRQRVREHWMLQGVTLVDPPSIFIDAAAEIGQDTVIQPFTIITGRTRIGEDCIIGPRSVVAGSTVGRNCKIVASVIEDSVIDDDVDVGPFSHLRSSAHIEADTHIGNFVEVKKSRMGRGSKAGHFSYLGDATLGENVNVGAGTITCNFDGVNKNPSTVEDDVFLGCDTMLVAPVKVGARARTGAGAVVTRDIPADVTVVGVPARPLVKKGNGADPERK